MSEQLPGKGLFGWLGRQIGYVTRAVRKDVGETTIYRSRRVQEQPLPHDPRVKLRRTVIDEAVLRSDSLPDASKQPPPEPPPAE